MKPGVRALEHAQTHIGQGEVPPGSNNGARVRYWLERARASAPNPWCAAFLYSMFLDAGSAEIDRIKYPASVLSWVETADSNGWRKLRPYRGYAVAFEWNGHNPHPDDHIGIVEKVLALPRSSRPLSFRGKWWIRTIEGNSGDRVRRNWRWVDPLSVAFIEIPG